MSATVCHHQCDHWVTFFFCLYAIHACHHVSWSGMSVLEYVKTLRSGGTV